MIAGNTERVLWLIVCASFSWAAIACGAELGKNPTKPEIVCSDTSTWPRAPKGLVRSFSIKTHEERIGFTLGKPVPSFRSVRWNWSSKGFEGEIHVGTWQNAEEARADLSSFLRWGISKSPKLWVNEGNTLGDIAWLEEDGEHVFSWFCRRNVVIRMEINANNAGAKTECLRLVAAVTAAIDSEKFVEDPKLVEVPAVRVGLPERGKSGSTATVCISGTKGKASDFECSCRATPYEFARVDTSGITTSNGDIHYTVDLRKAGEAQIVVYATDKLGMTTKVAKTILIE